MWAYETTFYQIYPLGFCGAPRENAAPVAEDELAQAANAAPNPDAPIMKIAQWADYLQELGIGAVLINPPLESDSHGYDTRSLRHLDRRLGGDADFAAVCETLHAHGIRVKGEDGKTYLPHTLNNTCVASEISQPNCPSSFSTMDC